MDFNIPKRRKDLVQKVIGSGIHKKIILAASLSKDVNYHSEGLSYAIPQPTLEFGSLCLKNALFLLPNNNEPSVPQTAIVNSQTVTSALPLTSSHNLGIDYNLQIYNLYAFFYLFHFSPFPPRFSFCMCVYVYNNLFHTIILGLQHATLMSQATIIESFNLKISVLAASAYVSLCLGDYILSLEHAKTLLSFNKLPGAYKLLGNLYAAESLIFMDKISEALEYLKPENLQDLHTTISMPEVQEKDKEKMEEVTAKPTKGEFKKYFFSFYRRLFLKESNSFSFLF